MTPNFDYPVHPGFVSKLALRFGRRGLILFSVGIVFALYGLAILFQARTGPLFSRKYDVITNWIDSPLWGWMWLTAAVVCLYFAFRRTHQTDVWGYTAAFIPPATWAVFYLYSWVVWFLTNGDIGLPTAWIGMIIWIDFAFLIRVCAGWDDPTDPVEVGVNSDEL